MSDWSILLFEFILRFSFFSFFLFNSNLIGEKDHDFTIEKGAPCRSRRTHGNGTRPKKKWRALKVIFHLLPYLYLLTFIYIWERFTYILLRGLDHNENHKTSLTTHRPIEREKKFNLTNCKDIEGKEWRRGLRRRNDTLCEFRCRLQVAWLIQVPQVSWLQPLQVRRWIGNQ